MPKNLSIMIYDNRNFRHRNVATVVLNQKHLPAIMLAMYTYLKISFSTNKWLRKNDHGDKNKR